MGQRTSLYDLHLALGAKMVDFGGWDMPLHYGSQVEEHHQVRRDCGVFDVSHMTVIDVTGPRSRNGFSTCWPMTSTVCTTAVVRCTAPCSTRAAWLTTCRVPHRDRLPAGGQRRHP